MDEVDSMYADLNDTLRDYRYTRYYKPDTAKDVIDNIENSTRYYSFGFERRLNTEGDTLIVTAVYPNSPANTAGLKKRDRLLFANELPLTGADVASLYLRTDSLFDNITAFKVLRNGEIEPLSPAVKEEIQDPTVYLDSLEGVPIITVTRFTQTTNDPDGTYKEFKNVLKEIKGAESAIIDMRGNGGGIVYHCTAMAAELSEPDKELVYDVAHYREGSGNSAVAAIDTSHCFARDFEEREGDGVDIKWVIMVNEYSASCTERFVAALKSARPQIIVVGQKTYGKGIGQSYMTTPLGGAAIITSFQTYYPNGETFHRVGVKLDREIQGEDYWERYNTTTIAALSEALKLRGAVLAKRAPIALKDLPPERLVKGEPGMYHFIKGNN